MDEEFVPVKTIQGDENNRYIWLQQTKETETRTITLYAFKGTGVLLENKIEKPNQTTVTTEMLLGYGVDASKPDDIRLVKL